MMTYKGYIGKVEFDDKAHIFTGEVINTRAVITFQGVSVEELEQAFKDSVDDYLAWCKEDGVEPEKPYSGKMNLRLDPATHRLAAYAAKLQGISLNKFIETAVEDSLSEKLGLIAEETASYDTERPK